MERLHDDEGLFQKRVVLTKLDIYVFAKLFIRYIIWKKNFCLLDHFTVVFNDLLPRCYGTIDTKFNSARLLWSANNIDDLLILDIEVQLITFYIALNELSNYIIIKFFSPIYL